MQIVSSLAHHNASLRKDLDRAGLKFVSDLSSSAKHRMSYGAARATGLGAISGSSALGAVLVVLVDEGGGILHCEILGLDGYLPVGMCIRLHRGLTENGGDL